MELEIVTIGNELLLGYTLDTNTVELATALTGAGARVTRTVTVPDDPSAIRNAVVQGLDRTRFVITTGGLGPTRDDMTKKVVADLYDAPLELDDDYLKRLRERFEKLGRGPMPESNRTQAEIPRGAIALPNPRGTAPGLWLDGPRGTVVMLPGVPREMRGLMELQLVPRIRERLGGQEGTVVTKSRVLRTTGVAESALADTLTGVEERIAPLTLAFLPSILGVDLRLTAWQLPKTEAGAALTSAAAILKPLLGSACYAEGETDLAQVLLGELRDAGLRLAVAESCTGGLIGQRITSIPGASRAFSGGVIAYEDSVKEQTLGVPGEDIANHGAVSEPVAMAMARGVASLLGAQAAIAVTGIAGPDGGSTEKPVGTVYIAVLVRESVHVARAVFPGGRDEIRARTAQSALDMLRRVIRKFS